MSRTTALTRLLGFGFYDDKFKEAEDGLGRTAHTAQAQAARRGETVCGDKFLCGIAPPPSGQNTGWGLFIKNERSF